MFWRICSAIGSRLLGPSDLSIPSWREHFFMFGVLRCWTCSQRTSTRSFPCTAPSSQTLRPSSRMCSDILGMAGRVRFSSLSPGREGCGSSQRDPKSLYDSGRPSLAGEGVVCGPPPSADPTTSGAPLVGPAASAAPLQPLPPGRSRAEPSRVATLKRLLRKSGFSRGAVLEMPGCVRQSTACLYQAKWLSFCGWCRGRDVAPVNSTILLIVDFFIHLHRDKGLSVSAIRGIGLP